MLTITNQIYFIVPKNCIHIIFTVFGTLQAIFTIHCIQYIDGNASKPHISKMHNVQETQKTVAKQTRNRVFATSIYFAFEF